MNFDFDTFAPFIEIEELEKIENKKINPLCLKNIKKNPNLIVEKSIELLIEAAMLVIDSRNEYQVNQQIINLAEELENLHTIHFKCTRRAGNTYSAIKVCRRIFPSNTDILYLSPYDNKNTEKDIRSKIPDGYKVIFGNYSLLKDYRGYNLSCIIAEDFFNQQLRIKDDLLSSLCIFNLKFNKNFLLLKLC
ncbi:hypothetical protein M0P65_05190 [Candidatus Gracilibacteria bacterium]|nr:hypothetical protein [Candidatus Gracilibacteria bacterium]